MLVALALVRGLLYATLTPPWQAPDETAHFEYAHLLARYRRPLTFADASAELEREIIHSLYGYRAWDYIFRDAPSDVPARLADAPFFWRSRTLTRFSLAYVPYALAVAPFLDQAVETQLYVMRLVSVLLAAPVIVLTFMTARLVEPGAPALAMGAALLVLFLPQHTYIMATVSDGNLAELLASVAVYQVAFMLQAGFTWRRAGLSVLCGSLAILTKATAYYLVPLSMIVGLEGLLRWGRSTALGRGWGRRRSALVALVALSAILLLLLRLLVLSIPPASNSLQSILFSLRQPPAIVSHAVGMAAEGSLWHALQWTFNSFWSTFGWMSLPLPNQWYPMIGAACALSGLGWVASLRGRRFTAGALSNYAYMALAAALPIAVLIGFFTLSPVGIHAYQGRYLFAGLVPLAVVLVRGWLSLVPARHSTQMLAVMTLGLVLLDASALLLVLVPFYYR